MIRKRRDRGYGPIFHDTKFSLIGEFADPTESELERLISLGGGRIVPPDGALNFSSYMIVPQTTTRHEAKMLGRRFGKRSISALWILDSISNGRKLETAKYVVGHTHAAWIRLALIAMPYALKRKAKGLVVFLFFFAHYYFSGKSVYFCDSFGGYLPRSFSDNSASRHTTAAVSTSNKPMRYIYLVENKRDRLLLSTFNPFLSIKVFLHSINAYIHAQTYLQSSKKSDQNDRNVGKLQ